MQTRDHYDVLISGGGPSAMGAAIQALKEGKTVCLVTDRTLSSFTREQKVLLDDEPREFLKLLFYEKPRSQATVNPEDLEFIGKLRAAHAIPIQEVERFLSRRLAEQDNATGNLTIHEYSKLVEADLAKGQAVIMSNQGASSSTSGKEGEKEIDLGNNIKTVEFTTLIAADGVNHPSVDLVNKTVPSKQQITYGTVYPNPHNYHISIFIPKIVTDDNTPLTYGDLSDLSKIEEAAIKVNDKGLYQAIILAKLDDDGTSVECNVNCEIPKKLFEKYTAARSAYRDNLPNPPEHVLETYKQVEQELIDHVENLIKQQLERKDINFTYNRDQNNFVKLNPFKTQLEEASKAYITVKNGTDNRSLVIIGDAFRSSYYPSGQGLNSALRQVINLDKVFAALGKNIEIALNQFNKASKSAASDVSRLIFAGTLFKKQVWNQSVKKWKENFSDYRKHIDLPMLHSAVKKNDLRKVKELLKENPKDVYLLDREKKNIIHLVSDPEMLQWLRNTYQDTFYQLLTQHDTFGCSPLFYITKTLPHLISELFPSAESMFNFRDYIGDTIAHVIMSQNNFEPVKDLMFNILGTNPQLFLVKNDEQKDAIDKFGKNYLHNCYNEELAKKYEQMFTLLRGTFADNPTVLAKLDDIVKIAEDKKERLQGPRSP